jgi:hypothetical protein
MHQLPHTPTFGTSSHRELIHSLSEVVFSLHSKLNEYENIETALCRLAYNSLWRR